MSSEAKTRILVLDDETIVLKRLGPALEKAGYAVDLFSRSADALNRVQETSFDIVITDLKMEGLDGMQFLTKVKALWPNFPILTIVTKDSRLGEV